MRKWICFWLICAGLVLPLASAGLIMASEAAGKTRVAHELLVKFVPETSEARKKEIRDTFGATLLSKVQVIGLEHWRLPESVDMDDAIKRLARMPEVEYAEPNYLYKPQAYPNDPDFDLLWYLDNQGQAVNGISGSAGADVAAPAAWDIQTGSPFMVIAVIDSGIAFDHPDISENIWSNPGEIAGNGIDDDNNGYVDDIRGWDFVNGDNNPSDYSRDLYGDGHGTHVAGVIAAEGGNGIGSTGVMWQAQIMPLQVFDLFESSPYNGAVIQGMNIIEAVDYATKNGAKIINCSFGGPGFSKGQFDIIEEAGKNGVLVVAAAGNEGGNNDDTPTYPAGYELDNIISVAATDESDRLADYSNYGPRTVDVAAPGGNGSVSNIYSLTPPPRVVLFSDDFESGGQNWMTSEREPWFIINDEEVFGSRVITDSEGDYAAGVDSYIQTVSAIDGRNSRGLNIRLDLEYHLEMNADFLFVEVSPDGSNFSSIFDVTGFSPGIERINLWSNDETPGEPFYLRFRLSTDESNNFDGVYLDNIEITGIKWDFTGNPYGFKSGTSMATPVISGIAGLILSQNPDFSPAQIRAILLGTVDPVNGLENRVLSGGRVNAASALQAAASGEIPDLPDAPGENVVTQSDENGDGGSCFISVLHAMRI